MLTDPQIDRYSRQIILPEFGGRGQERLLAAHLALSGEFDDLMLVADYLAGAGIGNIHVEVFGAEEAAATGANPDRVARWISRLRELNPDVRVDYAADFASAPSLSLVLAGSQRGLEASRKVNLDRGPAPLIFARLDDPGLIAVLPVRPPCLACAHHRLLAPFSSGPEETAALRRPMAGVVAMAAAGEAIRQLLGSGARDAKIAEFRGYEMVPSAGIPVSGCPVCG